MKRKRKNGSGKSIDFTTAIINSSIAILSILIIGFIISFSKKYPTGNIPIEITFPNENTSVSRTAEDIYNQNPILESIEVEILNGCGERGVANIFADFLRSNQVDVVRAENADHFNYNSTLVIQRTENLEGLKTVVTALGFDINDKSRVLIQPNSSLDVDITLIVGKDFKNLNAFNNKN